VHAAFFKDACALMAGTSRLKTVPHLVAHLLREVEWAPGRAPTIWFRTAGTMPALPKQTWFTQTRDQSYPCGLRRRGYGRRGRRVINGSLGGTRRRALLV